MFTLLTIGQTESNLTNIQHRVLMELPLAVFYEFKKQHVNHFSFFKPHKRKCFPFQVHELQRLFKKHQKFELSYVISYSTSRLKK